MSMICCLRRALDEELRRLLDQPELIRAFTWGGEAPAMKTTPGVLAALFGAKPRIVEEAIRLPADWSELRKEDETDLDKAWHGIHFLLTGSAWEGEEPLCYLIIGGAEIGEIDVGYGPARAITSEQTAAFAEALSAISREELADRFDREKMTEKSIYPSIWEDEEDDEPLEYLLSYCDTLKEFVRETAKQGKGLVVWLS